MKTLSFVFAFLTAQLFASDSTTPTPVFPSELKLTSGVTLHHASPTRWANDYVVVKHASGVDPIQYRYISPEQRAVVLEVKAQAGKSPAPTMPAPRTLSGQVFVTTQGAGAYKFGGAVVTAVSQAEFDYLKPIMENNLPLSFRNLHGWERDQAVFNAWRAALKTANPIGKAVTTDADGKYVVELPATGQFVLICTAYRLAGGSSEYNVWTVPTTERATLDLNSGNTD